MLGYGIYVAYAMAGSYLGSRTGQTHGLLPWGVATVVLTGWALALALAATRVSLRRELR